MNLKQIQIIWFKEVADTIRDRRTLMSMLVLPIFLMPLLIVGVSKFTIYQAQQAQNQNSTIAFENTKFGQSLVDFFKKQEKINVVSVDNLATAVKDKKIDAGIVIPADFEASLANHKSAQLNTLYLSTSENGSLALSRVTADVANFNNLVVQTRFQAQNINPTILVGATVNPADQTSEKERGGFFLGFLIPIFIVMWSIIGGQYTAIDVSAGEKERKTLESLLLTPISRLSLVAGKFLAVSTASLVSVVASIASLYFAIKYSGLSNPAGLNTGSTSGALGNLNISLDPAAIGFILLVSFLLILMFSAVILSLGIFAKSYREAQSYISPAYIVIILPIVLVNAIPNFSPGNLFFIIPAINAIFLFKELLLGVYSFAHIFITVFSLIGFSLLAIFIATIIYSKETILFKD